MKKKIITMGTVCALILTACGKTGQAVQTSSAGGTDGGRQDVGKIQIERADSQVITVSSRESVKVAPDMAQLVYGVTTQDKDAAQCQKENNEKVARLAEALKSMGIEEASIRTSDFDMRPRYDWDRNGAIVGYEATTQVVVSDIELEQAGEVMMQSVEAGVNQIQSVSFLSSRYDESYQEALKLAAARAQEKAQALADASGCTLGRAVHIVEYAENDSYRYMNRAMSGGAAAAEKYMMEDMAVMPGEIEVEASITVDFSIQ